MALGPLPITLTQIRTEYGGGAPDSLTEYYRGGAYVPNTPLTASIPTAGAISISNFANTVGGSIKDPAIVAGYTSPSTGIRQANVSFNTDGTTTLIGASTTYGSWWTRTPYTGIGSYYWVRITIDTQLRTTLGGTMTPGTWYQINAAYYITFSNSSSTSEGTGSFTVSFSTDGGSTVAASYSGQTWDVGYIP